jgi:hypothetical protein
MNAQKKNEKETNLVGIDVRIPVQYLLSVGLSGIDSTVCFEK